MHLSIEHTSGMKMTRIISRNISHNHHHISNMWSFLPFYRYHCYHHHHLNITYLDWHDCHNIFLSEFLRHQVTHTSTRGGHSNKNHGLSVFFMLLNHSHCMFVEGHDTSYLISTLSLFREPEQGRGTQFFEVRAP